MSGPLVVAHVGGVPVEELLPVLGGCGAALLVATAAVRARLRRRPSRRSGVGAEA